MAGLTIVTTPPQVQLHVEMLSSDGWLPSSTFCAPGAHGVNVAGTHGIGESTPIAAAVADATVGLASELHMPNGRMLTIGT
ncbi:hypothetical protein WK00_29155 [Burkholderia ubonensis]|nr:hypothetical protein WK00_29155 [Burkholderia ubonensis]